MISNPNSRTIQPVPLNALRLPDLAIRHHPKKQIEKAQKFLAANDQILRVYAGPDGKRGDVVVDSYLGSGSTLVAAEETGRVCCGVELDPLYIDVAIRRWQNATDRDAVLFETGEPFSMLVQRRLAASSEASHGV
jgi:hypothetical protein